MLEVINDFLSGKVLIVLIVGLGGYFTIRSRFVQLRHFFHMFAVFRDSLRSSSGQLSSFQALMLSLAGRVGAGNIAGVGIAVTLGGPGAVFWMWVTALVGMASSFFECSLGQLYKRCDSEGQYRGGPSYYIQHGLGKRWLGMVMAVLLLVTFGFAFNGLQSHAVTHSLNDAFGVSPTYAGIALAVLLGLVFIGGIKRIAAVADLLVPVKTLVYIAVTVYVIAVQFEHVPEMLMTIVRSAFGLDPVFGGLIGSAIVMGVKRGVFANEAGLGSAPNVAAVAQVEHPVAQGVVQAFSVFLDTFVICTCTALLILLSGFYTPGFEGDGIALTQNSLAAVVGDWGKLFISVALSLFVFTSILYNYYLGENSLRFLIGENRKALISYRAFVLALILWGAVEDLGTVFAFADITMTLLAFVNLIALAMLFKIGLRILGDYDEQRKAGIKTPVFDSSKFPDLDLDLQAWPKPGIQQASAGEAAATGKPVVDPRYSFWRTDMDREHFAAAKHVRVLYTGGTIGMQASESGLAPASGFEARMAEQLAALSGLAVPQWSFREMSPLIDSANMTPAYWQRLREAVAEAVDVDECDAVLILHGTDTLAYSAAAMSFQLLGLNAPVVFTGSMLPAGVPDSDAWENVNGALVALGEGLASGVHLYFHGALLQPTRCAKIRSFGRDPFAALNRSRSGEAALQWPVALDYRRPKTLSNIAVLPLFPGIGAPQLDALLDSGLQGLVLECFGSGTGPSDNPAFLASLERAHQQGTCVVAITQCQEGGVELDVYEAGSRLRGAGVLSGGGMTREAAFGKLHALIGASLSQDEVRRFMEVDMCGELR